MGPESGSEDWKGRRASRGELRIGPGFGVWRIEWSVTGSAWHSCAGLTTSPLCRGSRGTEPDDQ